MAATNDPRETEPWVFGMTIEDEEIAPSGEEFIELNKKIDELLKRSCLIACLTQDAPDLRPELGDPDFYVRNDIGLQGYEHDRMWAQYAGDHTGVCILFDREKLVRNMEEHFSSRQGQLIHGPVSYLAQQVDPLNSPFYELSYSEIHHMGVEEFARLHRTRFVQQLYFTKNMDWASEQEYRFVWIGEEEYQESKAEYVSIEDCITDVCLGTHFPDVYTLNIRDTKNSLGINVHQVRYMYGKMLILPMLEEDVALVEAARPTIQPDPTFGDKGVVETKIGDASDAHCGLLLPNGEILAGGGTTSLRANGTLRNEGFALARYSPEGYLDTAFGDSGIVKTGVGAFHDGIRALDLRSDGKIVAGGTSRLERSGTFTLVRYDGEGNLDQTFGESGVAITRVGVDAQLHSIAVQGDGKIVACGTSRINTDRTAAGRQFEFTVARFSQDGRVDPTFGQDGIVTTKFLGRGGEAMSVVIQPDGKILAAGCCGAAREFGFALARYEQGGSLDTSFGRSGKQSIIWGEVGGQNRASALALQTDGKIVIAGQVHSASGYDFALARYGTDGSPDMVFGDEGVVRTPVGRTGQAYVNDVVVQPETGIVRGGYADGHYALARYDFGGALDPNFGEGGLGTTDFGGQNGVQALLSQPDGKVIAVGANGGGSESIFALARYPTDSGALSTE